MEIIIAIVIFLVLIGIKIKYDEHKYIKNTHARLVAQWGKLQEAEYSGEKMQEIAAFYRARERETPEAVIDDITWNDLDMDRVYQQVNHTQSAMGQEYLYYLMRTPKQSVEELSERERLISFFERDEEKRLALEMKLSTIGKSSRFSVYSYLKRVDELEERNNIVPVLQMLALFLGVVLCFFWPEEMIVPVAAIAIYNMVTYYMKKAEMEHFYQLFAYIVRTVHFAKELAALDIPELKNYFEPLSDNAAKFGRFCRGSSLVVGGGNMDGSLTDTLMDYVRLLTHIDIIKFQSMAKEVIRLEEELMEMYSVIGFLDSMISAASYRVLKMDVCVPEFCGNEKYLEIEGLVHPLIDEPVKNTICAGKNVLLTGSNASGKSTFIKSVAINVILAQTLHTVLADSYRAGFFRVYTSMALRDDLQSKESYYIVEIKSLKRIMDRAEKEGVPVLCFIDEVLRGTNTVERIASSTEILSMLADANAKCFAATHDIELASLLSDKYENYHFEERVEDEDVLFDYKLRKGKAMTRNAIKLLGMIGYQPEMINRAEQRVQKFLEDGVW